MSPDTATAVTNWLAALEARHLADLRLPEVTRALRALSSAYVERRQALSRGAALDTKGKRAAFGLFYAPLHFLIAQRVIDAVAPDAPTTIVDLGCGTGTAGAAWALASSGRPQVIGIDRHPWAVDEARWTYRQLGLDGAARQGDVVRTRLPKGDLGIVVAYVMNELGGADRDALIETLVEAAGRGARVLVIEPIARAIAPWWDAAAARFTRAGGRADEWRLALSLPPIVAKLDTAAGLDHHEVKARSLFIGHSR